MPGVVHRSSVIDLYNDGISIHADLDQLGAGATFGELSTQGAIERAVFALLREPSAGRRSAAARQLRRPDLR